MIAPLGRARACARLACEPEANRHQLGGQHTMVRRVDLGTKGVYYRAMVGPLASSEAARHMCSKLRAAGASYLVQRIQAGET